MCLSLWYCLSWHMENTTVTVGLGVSLPQVRTTWEGSLERRTVLPALTAVEDPPQTYGSRPDLLTSVPFCCWLVPPLLLLIPVFPVSMADWGQTALQEPSRSAAPGWDCWGTKPPGLSKQQVVSSPARDSHCGTAPKAEAAGLKDQAPPKVLSLSAVRHCWYT